MYGALKGTQARGSAVCHSHCPLQWASGNPGADQPTLRPRLHAARGAQVAPRAVACCKAKENQRSAAVVPRTKKIKFCKSFPHLLPTPPTPKNHATNKSFLEYLVQNLKSPIWDTLLTLYPAPG